MQLLETSQHLKTARHGVVHIAADDAIALYSTFDEPFITIVNSLYSFGKLLGPYESFSSDLLYRETERSASAPQCAKYLPKTAIAHFSAVAIRIAVMLDIIEAFFFENPKPGPYIAGHECLATLFTDYLARTQVVHAVISYRVAVGLEFAELVPSVIYKPDACYLAYIECDFHVAIVEKLQIIVPSVDVAIIETEQHGRRFKFHFCPPI